MKTVTIALLISAIVLPAAPLLAQGGRMCSDGRTVLQQCEEILRQAENDVRVNFMAECTGGAPGRDAISQESSDGTGRMDQIQMSPASGEQCMALGSILSGLNSEQYSTCVRLNVCH